MRTLYLAVVAALCVFTGAGCRLFCDDGPCHRYYSPPIPADR
jgi:hypothetical protein